MFTTQEGIKIYAGHTQEELITYENNIAIFKDLYKGEPLFSPLQPSTLTAEGKFSDISFNESTIFNLLTEPTEYIVMIGCNYGERFNTSYETKIPEKHSLRGRKPKVKPKSRRKIQGTGKYFSSQITFEILHPDTKIKYKIKLFRNGKFQAPGVRQPDMFELIKPINILRDYLRKNFSPTVYIIEVMAVMRNYKAHLLDEKLRVDLEKLEDILTKYKKNGMEIMLDNKYLKIAEMTYNTDRCVMLIVKFKRPQKQDPDKKTTVKLLKTGKLNWDGCFSELEAKELYHWMHWLYFKHKDEILFNIDHILSDEGLSDTDAASIYDEEYVPTIDTLSIAYNDITEEQRADIGDIEY